ncbi:hypothetical protein EDD85DRAFT_798934, partial [Armillaria nabsnona]
MKVVVAFRCGEVESEERGGRSRMMRTTSKAGGIRAVAVVPEGRLRGRWRRRRRRREALFLTRRESPGLLNLSERHRWCREAVEEPPVLLVPVVLQIESSTGLLKPQRVCRRRQEGKEGCGGVDGPRQVQGHRSTVGPSGVGWWLKHGGADNA